MPRRPYHIARQEHLGDVLDRLQDLSLITWKWDYEVRKGRESGSAVYWVTEPGRRRRKLDTKRAEELALRLCQQESIVWLAVPHPGGETQRAETLRKIEDLQRGIHPAEASTAGQIHPIEPVPFDLAPYPELQRRLDDEPSGDRSAQTFSAACRCVELGLHDGQVKWFLAQYPPLLDKYGGRAGGADRELDRVVAKARKDTSG
jgi:hypothetical protein